MTGAANTAAPTRMEIGLVLQGGGALGAYEWGGILALFDLMDEAEKAGLHVALRAVTGVSIGAINAACIVGARDRNDARDRLGKLWNGFMIRAPFLSTRRCTLQSSEFLYFSFRSADDAALDVSLRHSLAFADLVRTCRLRPSQSQRNGPCHYRGRRQNRHAYVVCQPNRRLSSADDDRTKARPRQRKLGAAVSLDGHSRQRR